MGRTPESVNIEGEDILDFAVGDKHILVLTMSHRLWVIGSFKGQGDDSIQRTWKEITLSLKKGQKVVNVYAGYRTSFALVDEEGSEGKE
jgi:alpha-tubulin suppressor-like RCC1 family protein